MKHRTLLAASLAAFVASAADAQVTPPPKPAKKAGQEPGKAAPKKAVKPVRMQAIRLTGGGFGVAKPPTQEELIERRDKKLAEAWVGKVAWTTDYDAARKTAAATDKKVFAYFTRSYAP